jgi:Holliday junction resolvase RusA-like endonuclease
MSKLATTGIAVVEDGSNLSLSFVVAGAPQVQQRPKMSPKKGKRVPTYYDPSSLKKKDWKKDLKKALVNYGVSSFPFFKEKNTHNMQSNGLHLEVVFYIRRRQLDYRSKMGTKILKDEYQKYPGTKDIDNMLKFVMDAYHDVLFDNDNCVVQVSASKKFVKEEEREKGAYTTIRISTI